MNRILVRLMLWCLLAALPLQGFAAALRICGDHAAPKTVQTHEAGHDHHNAGYDHHEATAQHAHADTPVQGCLDDSSCSACAACCVGACAPPSWPSLPTIPHGSAAVALTPAPLVSGYIPGGLERPPRHSHA
ncbi:hypothetical protein ACFDR9_001210 [Janthinobacterium sp. CG_23.3]|uniref:hypothetical protein n=1 Tax=Janthinobacterium sp. CG_23.3 TaxID=3349634 RepID=UPI0038D45F02